MMDGYSVQDAASVLGVPEGRVWELLARGVLAGSPDGDSMRVFLKTDAAQVTRPAPPEALPRGNGNGGSHSAEASAFRELLTEFRNLTERYGQALLALGEARGEVAGLRSRVDLLEARLDLRLPAAVDVAPVSWEAPAPPAAPAPEPAGPADVEAVRPAPAPVRRTTRPRKGRTTRAAVAGFADALARAQDPNPAEVGEAPISPEVATELVAEPSAADGPIVEASPAPEIVAEVAVEADTEEVVVADLAVEADTEEVVVADAEEVVVADAQADKPPEPTYAAAVVEPDWFADGDFSWLDAADLEARSQAEVIAAAPAVATPEVEGEEQAPPEPVIAAMPEPEQDPVVAAVADPEPVIAAMPEPEPVIAAMPEPEPVFAAAPEPEPSVTRAPEPESEPVVAAMPEPELEPGVTSAPEPEPEPVVTSTPEPEPEPEPVVASAPQPESEPEPVVASAPEPEPEPAGAAAPDPQPAAFGDMEPVEVGGAGEEAVMWIGGPREAADEIPVASAPPHPEPTAAPRTEDVRGPEAWPDSDRGGGVAQAVAPPLAMTEEELAQLAREEGWDDTEVGLIRAMISRPAPREVHLPGAAELDEAMSALEAVPIESHPEGTSGRQWAKPATPDEERSGYDDWAFDIDPAPPQTRAPLSPPPANRAAPDPDWLRRRRGPAATAYRRIRRIFSG